MYNCKFNNLWAVARATLLKIILIGGILANWITREIIAISPNVELSNNVKIILINTTRAKKRLINEVMKYDE